MKRMCFFISLIFMLTALTSLAAEQTWTGKISDSKCGASHKAMEHGGLRQRRSQVCFCQQREGL
jgi:hypothetical protein